MKLKLCESSLPLPLESSSFRANSIHKHFSLLPKRCRYHIQELFSNGQHLNISKQFLVHVVKEINKTRSDYLKLTCLKQTDASNSLAKTSTTGCYMCFHAIIYHMLKRLVPLLGFCVKCIMDAFHHRVARNKLQDVHQASRSMRWKLALRDLSDPDALYSDSRPEIDNITDDREHLQSEELSHAYAKLDDDYQKFLSECGMSKCCYWCGGSGK